MMTLAPVAVTLAVMAIYKLENMLIYPTNYPVDSRYRVDTPDLYDIPFEDVTLETPDGVTLRAYIMTVRHLVCSAPESPTNASIHDRSPAMSPKQFLCSVPMPATWATACPSRRYSTTRWATTCMFHPILWFLPLCVTSFSLGALPPGPRSNCCAVDYTADNGKPAPTPL